MLMVTPSTCVTGHPDTGPNSTPCDNTHRKMCNSQMLGPHMRRWFSGRILACLAGAPGSLPG